MQLGTQTSSVVNHLHSRAVIGEPKPVVGMGATVLGWTDRYPATIVSVVETTASKVAAYLIEVVEDCAKCISGSEHDGSAEYEFTPGDGAKLMFRKNKKTLRWEAVERNAETGRLFKTNGKGIRIGERDKYRDPSF